ncbi:MAG: hypothetical protein ABSC02_00080 [Acidobacteriota bacterium]|jgi:hypothetical protein
MRKCIVLIVIILLAQATLNAIESGQYRLLSVTDVQKWILISQSPEKPKYILDASTAKITVDGKPAEFKELSRFSVINVKFEFKKSSKDGITVDGVASEIRILTPEQPKKADAPIQKAGHSM